jgi:hypothetical protein
MVLDHPPLYRDYRRPDMVVTLSVPEGDRRQTTCPPLSFAGAEYGHRATSAVYPDNLNIAENAAFAAAMAAVLMARSVAAFMLSWELMALVSVACCP